MDISLILNAVTRIETDLALIKAQLDPVTPTIKVEKLSKKQLLHQQALLTLEERKQKDGIRARKKFKKELDELKEKRKELTALEEKINLCGR